MSNTSINDLIGSLDDEEKPDDTSAAEAAKAKEAEDAAKAAEAAKAKEAEDAAKAKEAEDAAKAKSKPAAKPSGKKAAAPKVAEAPKGPEQRVQVFASDPSTDDTPLSDATLAEMQLGASRVEYHRRTLQEAREHEAQSSE